MGNAYVVESLIKAFIISSFLMIPLGSFFGYSKSWLFWYIFLVFIFGSGYEFVAKISDGRL